MMNRSDGLVRFVYPTSLVTEKLHSQFRKKVLGTLCAVVILGILIATLYPFNFFTPNRISWLPAENGLSLEYNGVVLSKSPLVSAPGDSGKACSLELFLRPASTDSVHTILNFYTPGNPKQFQVRQWTDGLLVSKESVDVSNRARRTKFDVDHAFHSGKLLLLTITSGPSGTVVYSDGVQTQVFPRFRITQADVAGQIVIGSSTAEYEPWRGEVRGLAIYLKELSPDEVLGNYENWKEGRGVTSGNLDRTLAYFAFNEGTGHQIHNAVTGQPDLEIPTRFVIPHKPFLKSPVKEFEPSWKYMDDVLRNIAGFVPLGFLLGAYWGLTKSRGQTLLYTIFAGGLLSFLIELLQFYIPQRYSGITDILTNTLGTALGALLAQRFFARANAHEPKSLSR